MLLREGGDIGHHRVTPQMALRSAEKDKQLVIRGAKDWQLYLHPANMLKTINNISHGIEMAPRRAVFEAELARGATPRIAAVAARRSTVDFNRAGTAVRFLNSFYMFLNPAVQGSLLIPRMARDSKTARFSLAGFLAMKIAQYTWNRQFEEYQDVPNWAKYSLVTVMLPSERHDNNGNKIPNYITFAPLREFALLGAPLDYVLESIDKKNPQSLTEFLKFYAEELSPVSSFVGSKGLAYPSWPAQIVSSYVRNHNTFTDRPVVPPLLERKEAQYQYDENTSLVARRIGSFFNASPMKIDQLLKIGVFEDLVLGADAAIRWFDKDGDPEAEGLAAQLMNINDQFQGNPSAISKQRDRFLKPYWDDIRDSDKEPGMNISMAQRILDAEKTLQAEQRISKVPFVGSIVDRFYRHYGGASYAQKQLRAERETGLSIEETESFGSELEIFLENNTQVRNEYESQFQAGTILPSQWLELSKQQTLAVQMFIKNAIHQYPNAVQTQTDPAARRQWYDILNTRIGTMEDTRHRGALLSAAFYGTPMVFDKDGNPDMPKYYRLRDEMREALSPEDQRLMDEHIERRVSPGSAEDQRIKDFKVLEDKYWSIPLEYMKMSDVGAEARGAAPFYEQMYYNYLDTDPQARRAKYHQQADKPGSDVRLRYFINILKEADKKQREVRQEDSEVSSLGKKWGFFDLDADGYYYSFWEQTFNAETAQ